MSIAVDASEDLTVPVYPRPRIPGNPVLSFASFSHESGEHFPSVLDAGSVKSVTSGRMAIALALQQMKIGHNDKVLVPAYHCSSMIEPVLWVGAKPVFYKINPDTSIDLDDIRSKLDGSTKLLAAVNYFGFPQDLSKIRDFCDEHKLLFLEDCAHSFFGKHNGKPVGSFGDYAIASSMKFFPIYDGGCLVSSRHPLHPIGLVSAGAGFELKAAFNSLERGFEYDRMALLNTFLQIPIRLKNYIWRRIKEQAPSRILPIAPIAADGGFGFDSKWIDKRPSLSSRHILKLVSRTRIVAKRRANYSTLHNALSCLPGCRPLFPELPDGVVPWVFPLITDEPKKVFPLLKNGGIPITRFGEYLWPGVDARTCSATMDLSRRVMQFPCHQELLDDELDWMITKVKAVLIGSTVK